MTIYTESAGSELANVSGHQAAQRAVGKFAKAFNAALGNTSNCTTGLDAAWTTATTAWATFGTTISSLSSAEQAYAKNLIRYATAQYTAGTDENFEYSLERAMKTYEICVTKHEKTAFMSDVRPLTANTLTPPMSFKAISENTAMLFVAIAGASVLGIGGLFLIQRKRRSED